MHLDQFAHLFEGLSADHRRTGIEATLHRVSRVIHAITKEAVAITARVGRVIQGGVLPMLLPSPEGLPGGLTGGGQEREAALVALAALARKGMLLVGPPNVGKTTVKPRGA